MLKVFAIRASVAVACVFALGAAGVAGVASAAAVTNRSGIFIGPIKTGHGYSVTVDETSCPARRGGLAIEFSKGSKVSVSHSYTGGASACSVSSDLSAGSVSATWGGLATINLAVTKLGKLVKLMPPRGCTGRPGVERRAVAVGTLTVAIHPGVFGKIKVSKATAFIQRFGSYKCNVAGASDATLSGSFGKFSLKATQTANGRRSVLISGPGTTLAGRINDRFVLDAEGGSSLFNIPSSLDSAVIGKAGPYAIAKEGQYLSGTLTFTALPACSAGLKARWGSFNGALVVRDPLRGSLTLKGSKAAGNGHIAVGNAVPGFCNGPGSVRPTVDFTSLCEAPGTCAISSTPPTNTDTFYDQSAPGSGMIVGEVWNFGDGSAPISGPVGGTVTHTYAIAGVYTATLTLIDAQGVTYQASGTVYIGA